MKHSLHQVHHLNHLHYQILKANIKSLLFEKKKQVLIDANKEKQQLRRKNVILAEQFIFTSKLSGIFIGFDRQ